jgi:hypothetical protein
VTALRTRGPRTLAVGLALLVLLVLALIVVLQREPRRAGTNMTPLSSVAIALAAGQELCEPGELVPADTAGLRVIVRSSGPTGPLRARVLGPGGVVARGSLAAGWRPEQVTVPLSRVGTATSNAIVCLRNGGSSQLLFGGALPDPPYTYTVAGQEQSGRLRIDYMRPGRESWLGLLTPLTYRFSLGRSPLTRSWASGAVLVLMLAVVALTAWILLRTERGEP